MFDFSIFDGIIKNAMNHQEKQQPKLKNNRWKYCVALSKKGWKMISCERVDEQFRDDIIIKWGKEGEKDITIRLSFTEQCLWFEYMQMEDSKK